MKVFHYIRVSTKQQNEKLQLDAAKKFNEENNITDAKYYIDKQKGTNMDRPELKAMLKAIGKDDLVVVWKIDRLSRSYADIKKIWTQITECGADIVSITQPMLDSRQYKDLLGDFISDLILSIFGYVAQSEAELRAERAKAGIKAMQLKNGKRISIKTGNPIGRPAMKYPKNFENIVQQQQKKEISLKQALAALEMPKSSYYKLLQQWKEEDEKCKLQSNY